VVRSLDDAAAILRGIGVYQPRPVQPL